MFKAKFYPVIVLFIVITEDCFSVPTPQDTTYVNTRDYVLFLKNAIQSLRENSKRNKQDLKLLHATCKAISKATVTLKPPAVFDSLFNSKGFAQYKDYLNKFLESKDSLSHLIDSLYYFSSFGWSGDVTSDAYTVDQKLLAGYYFLGSRAAPLINASLQQNVGDSAVTMLKTGFNSSLAELNARSRSSGLLQRFEILSSSAAVDLKKLTYYLKGLLSGEDPIEAATKYAEVYERLWNGFFIRNVKNVQACGIKLSKRETSVLENYCRQIVRDSALFGGNHEKFSNYALTFNWNHLVGEIESSFYQGCAQYWPESGIPGFLTDSVLQKLDIYELTYIAKSYFPIDWVAHFADSVAASFGSMEQQIKEYEDYLLKLEKNVETFSEDGTWNAFNNALKFEIDLKPEKDVFRVRLLYVIKDGVYVETGVSFDNVFCKLASASDLLTKFSDFSAKNRPKINQAEFRKFLQRLGFIESFVDLSELAVSLDSMSFSYLGASLRLTPIKLVEFQSQIARQNTDNTIQVYEALKSRLAAQVKGLLNEGLLSKSIFVFRNVPIDEESWNDFSAIGRKISISSDEVTIKIYLNEFSPLLDSSFVLCKFSKSGMLSSNLSISQAVYDNIMRNAFPALGLELMTTAPERTYLLTTPDKQKIGRVAIRNWNVTFTPAGPITLNISPRWTLKLNDYILDVNRSKLTFKQAEFGEDQQYSRFGAPLTLSGDINLKSNNLSVTLSPASARTLQDVVSGKLEEWQLIPDGLSIKSVRLDKRTINVQYDIINDQFRSKIDSTMLTAISELDTDYFQSEKYRGAISALYAITGRDFDTNLRKLINKTNRRAIRKFIDQYSHGGQLKFGNNITAAIKSRTDNKLTMAISLPTLNCRTPVFDFVVENGTAKIENVAKTCLQSYLKKLVPNITELTAGAVNFDEKTLDIEINYAIKYGQVEAGIAVVANLNGNIRIDDHILVEKSLIDQISSTAKAELNNRIEDIVDSLMRVVADLENKIEEQFGDVLLDPKVISKGRLPQGLEFDLKFPVYEIYARKIRVELDGTIDYRNAQLDLESLKNTLNAQLNTEVVTIENLRPILGIDQFGLDVTLGIHEEQYLNIYTTVTKTIDLTRGKISIDVEGIIKNLGISILVFNGIFQKEDNIQFNYDDLSISLIKSRSTVEETLVSLGGEALISKEPGVPALRFLINIPTDATNLNGFGIKLLTSQAEMLKSLEDVVLGFFTKKFGKLGPLHLFNPRFIHNSKNIPTGFTMDANLKLDFLKGVSVSLPQVVVDKKGISFGEMNRIFFSIPLDCPVPPWFILAEGYGEFSEDHIRLGGIMTIIPDGKMADVILMDGSHIYEFKKPLALTSKSEMKLFRIITLGTDESTIDLSKGTLERRIQFGGPFSDIISFDGKGLLSIEGLQPVLKGDGDLTVFKANIADARLTVNLKERIATSDASFDVIGHKFSGEFSSGKNFLQPALTGNTALKVWKFEISGAAITIQENWADLMVSFMGIKTGITAPSYHQLDLNELADLLKGLLKPDLDVREALKQVLNGNFKINPFSNFGGGKGNSKGSSGSGRRDGGGMRENFAKSTPEKSAGKGRSQEGGSGMSASGPDSDSNPNAISVVNGKYVSKLMIKKHNYEYWMFDGDYPVTRIPSALKFLSGGRIAPDVSVIDVSFNTVCFISGSTIYAFSNNSYCSVTISGNPITTATVKQKLKNETLRMNLILCLQDALRQNKTKLVLNLYDNERAIYYTADRTLTYYYLGRGMVIDNAANIDPITILDTEVQE